MQIPDSPEQLFEAMASETVREVFPSFDSLAPFQQKIVHILHTAMVKGELSDVALAHTIYLTTELWSLCNNAACLAMAQFINANDTLSVEIIEANADIARINQFIESCRNLHDAAPECIESIGALHTYGCRRPDSP